MFGENFSLTIQVKVLGSILKYILLGLPLNQSFTLHGFGEKHMFFVVLALGGCLGDVVIRLYLGPNQCE
ncbi:hypothetical protein GCM10011520_36220 [Shewanella carassii]|uniref:Uncharacterized protein n=1 Tax=Shewanella carassii TaxID=1987584 RepID=A0ABQ1TEF7_9GAMM|nr:hypothetical protein GCM10011520_36220 [Shewanella carassii]